MPGRGGVMILGGILIAVALYYRRSPFHTTTPDLTADDVLQGVPFHPVLTSEEANLDEPQIIKVTDDVWVAVGYAFGNAIMLEGPNGLIIVDTTEREDLAATILREFRKISRKPIVAIIHTHNHGDHTLGTAGFIEDPAHPPEIWGHELMLKNDGSAIGPRSSKYAAFQFGTLLGRQQSGMGIYLLKAFMSPELPILPTKLVRGDENKVNIAGLNLTLLFVPGESKDQLVVWLEDRRILLSADKIARLFPNVYTLRSHPARDSLEWARSLTKLRSLGAEYLVPSHFLPLKGAKDIYDHFTIYISGLQFVHDQTVRYMNKGLHPDDVASRVNLPKSLASHQYMQQVYGKVEWNSKAVFDQYVGWFNGDPADLFPHTPQEMASRMVHLVGETVLLSQAESALEDDPQWALKLSSYVTTADPENALARGIRGRALRMLAGRQSNHIARNFYLTAALENHGLFQYNINTTAIVDKMSMAGLLSVLKFRIKAEETEGTNVTVVFHFTDTNETFRLQILYSVLNIDPISNGMTSKDFYDSKVTTTTRVWKDINLKRLTLLSAAESGALKIDGSLTSFRQFMSFLDT